MSAGGAPNHEHLGPANAATLATRDGTRATWISLGILAITAGIQLAAPPRRVGDVARRPYGYRRAEDVAGLAIVMLIGLSAVLARGRRFAGSVHPQELEAIGWVLAAGVVGFVGNEAVARYRIVVGRRIGSAALVADGLHARTDGLASLGVIVTAIGAMLGFPRGRTRSSASRSPLRSRSRCGRRPAPCCIERSTAPTTARCR